MWRMLSQCLRCHVVTLAAENIKWLNLEYLAYADIAGNRGDQQHRRLRQSQSSRDRAGRQGAHRRPQRLSAGRSARAAVLRQAGDTAIRAAAHARLDQGQDG